ncbi:hypothetical protein HKD37_11G030851 [Glycine soja]
MNGNMRQPSDEVPPPFTSTAKGSNSLIPAAMGINDDLQTKDLEERSENSFGALVVLVEDILEKLIPYAAKSEIFILGVNGEVTVLVAGSDGLIRGGPVRSLIAKSSIRVFVSTTSKHDTHNMASEEYPTENDEEVPLFLFEDQAERMADASLSFVEVADHEMEGGGVVEGKTKVLYFVSISNFKAYCSKYVKV